jgi:acyl dehydratase
MTVPNFTALQVGDALPAFQTEPISRLGLALYCGASGDHNPIHVDIDFARAAGQQDVFAHGMLSMAYLGRLLTNWVPQQQLRQFGVRFVAITQVGDRITCRGTVLEKFEAEGEKRVRLELSTVDAEGNVKLSGDAVVTLP